MATALKLEPVETGTDIVLAVNANPGIVLLDTAKFDVFYESLKAKAPTDADVATRKGQEALRSFAATVRSEKSAIDKARLRLTKEWRDMTSQANEAGKVIEQRLESLAVEVRAPLTAWEEAEKARVAECRADIEAFKWAGTVSIDDTAAAVRERGADLWQQPIDAARYGDMAEEAQAAKDAAVATLKTALERLTREEADRAELDRLRTEAAEREAREQAERDAAAQAQREAEAARVEEQRQADIAKAEADRIANAERDAADRARREADAAAEAERQRIQREHDAALQAERAARAKAEREAQEERDRIAAAEAARIAESERAAAAQAKLDNDKAHRGRVMKAAKEAIMTCGIDEDAAKKVVLLIRAGEVPNVKLAF